MVDQSQVCNDDVFQLKRLIAEQVEEHRRKRVAFDELLAACRTCDEEIAAFLVVLEGFNIEPRSPVAIKLRAAGLLAKREVEKAEKTKGGTR